MCGKKFKHEHDSVFPVEMIIIFGIYVYEKMINIERERFTAVDWKKKNEINVNNDSNNTK